MIESLMSIIGNVAAMGLLVWAVWLLYPPASVDNKVTAIVCLLIAQMASKTANYWHEQALEKERTVL